MINRSLGGARLNSKIDSSPATPAYARYVLATLLSVYMIHHLDRMTISLLLEPLGREFKLSDA